MILQCARPSSPIMAISENRFPLDIGQLTVISSLALDHALSLVIYKLNPDSSKKYIFACLSNNYLYFVQKSYRFYSDLLVFFYFGMYRTLFFLNLPIFSNFAIIDLFIYCGIPSFQLFKSSILLSSTQT